MSGQSLQRQILVRDGVKLAWYDSGGPGVPVLFQHGLGGDVGQTREAFPSDERYRLITLECRGHGQSDAGDISEFGLLSFADDIAALLDQLALGPIIVGGVSMGAALVMRLAVRRADLVSGLIMVRPAWGTEAAPPNMAPNLEVGDLLARLTPAEAEAAFAAGPTAKRLALAAPDNLASLLGFFCRQPASTISALLCKISKDGPGVSVAGLRALAIPTLIMGTEADDIHPWPLAARLAKIIPGARLKRVTPKGIDKPAYLADLHGEISAFIEDLSHA